MAKPYNPPLGPVLVIDEEPDWLRIVGRTLRDVGYFPILVNHESKAWDRINTAKPKAIIWTPPFNPEQDSDNLEFLERLREAGLDLPVIIHTGGLSSELVRRAFMLGADDVIWKSQFDRTYTIRLIEELLLSRATKATLLYGGQSDEALSGIKAQIAFVDRRLMEYLASHPLDLHKLNPRQFEEVIAEIWHGAGYRVMLTPRSKDGGKDIYAVTNSGFGELLYVIECKRYNIQRPVTVEIVRALYGVTEAERATMGLIATTSHFTGPALDFQKRIAPHRMTLRDFKGVSDWLSDYSKRLR
jgi:CheY-like chemotaxis protein